VTNILKPLFILLSILCKATLFILAVLCFQRRTTARRFRDWYHADKLLQTERKLQYSHHFCFTLQEVCIETTLALGQNSWQTLRKLNISTSFKSISLASVLLSFAHSITQISMHFI